MSSGNRCLPLMCSMLAETADKTSAQNGVSNKESTVESFRIRVSEVLSHALTPSRGLLKHGRPTLGR